MPLDRGTYQQDTPSPLAVAPLSPSHYLTSIRAPSPSTSAAPAVAIRESSSMTSTTSSPAPPVRPRHHIRSFSVENRFSTTPSSSNSRHTSVQNGNADALPSPSIIIDPSSPPTTNVSPPFVSTSPLPVRVKRSPPLHTTSPSLGSSPIASPTKGSHSPKATSPSRGSNGGSPVKSEKSLETEKEEKRLALLRQQQANRRPKMMRLTPAFSSTPNSLRNSSKFASQESASNDVQFPAKTDENDKEPGVGLQIDLGCIPTPSLQDLNGPISTSHLDSLIRDRNGNPIKPSLKSPRASVSHFLPGRTSRSDSTPALPSSLHHSKSVPSTPTVHKAVHFDSQLEHIKLFKNKQRPTAVSRDGSPEQTETETEEEKDLFPYIWRKNSNGSNSTSPTTNNSLFGASSASSSSAAAQSGMTRSMSPHAETEEQLVLRLPNFPSSTRLSVDREIFLERIFLAEDLRSVKGSVQVRNMSFEKWVAVRYTLDHWATIGEVSAEYSETIKGGQADRFTFSIKLNELLNWPRGSAAHETKSMFMCLRYTVNSTEFWDNNEGLNYQLDFRKRQVPSTPLSTPTAAIPLAQPRASVAQSNATRSKVFEIARRGVTGGKGMFAMEDLKRELDKLRSDEEVEEFQSITTPRSLASELAKKKASPPTSPGRSSSPSATAWTARYDFGQSLRNPRSGSRNTGSGRAAALDYFSAKPMSRNNSSQQVPKVGNVQPQGALHSSDTSSSKAKTSEETHLPLQASSTLATGKFEGQMAQRAKDSPDFSHRFGMLSPGLADGPVEHRPTLSSSDTPSASVSPSPTPTPSTNQSPMSAQSFSSDSNRFNNFPPTRHSGSNTPTNGAHMSPAFFTPTEELEDDAGALQSSMPNMDMLNYVTTAFKSDEAGMPRSDGLMVTSYSPSASPISDCESPNPFSPTDSLSSTESDTTVSHSTTPDDRHQHRLKGLASFGHARRSDGSSGSIGSIGSFGSALQGGTLTASSSTASSLDIPGGFSSSFHAPSVSATAPSTTAYPQRTARTPTTQVQQVRDGDDGDKLRPASMSDYQELINKYCWNNDLVPSGGSTIPDMPTNGGLNGSMTLPVDGHSATKLSPSLKSPALSGSGASTPTPR